MDPIVYSFHAPRRWAVLASVAGFSPASALFVSTESTLEGQVTEHQVTFPSTSSYGALTGPVEIRVVPFSGQYAGHPAALVAFRLAQAGAPSGFTSTVRAISSALRRRSNRWSIASSRVSRARSS